MVEIVIALVSGLSVAIPSVIATISSNKKNNDLIKYQITELKLQVEKHNNVIERVYKLEQSRAVHEEEFHNLQKDLEELKKGVN